MAEPVTPEAERASSPGRRGLRSASAYGLHTGGARRPPPIALPPSPPPRAPAERSAARAPAWQIDEAATLAPVAGGGPDEPLQQQRPRATTLQSEFVAREHLSSLKQQSVESAASRSAERGFGAAPPLPHACTSSSLGSAAAAARHGSLMQVSRALAAVRAAADSRREWEAAHAELAPAERQRARALAVLDSTPWAVLTTLLTVYVLFAPDVRLAATTADADAGFVTMTVLSFVLFAAELKAQAAARPGFKYSFFFWLDALATISLVVDMPFIMDPMIALFATISSADPQNAIRAASQTVTARAGRIAMLGAKAGRLANGVGLSRTLRLTRALSLTRSLSARACGQPPRSPTGGRRGAPAASPMASVRARAQVATSQTGRLLAEKLTQYTIIGCLAFLLGFSMLNRHELLEGDDRRLLAIQRVERLVAAHHNASLLPAGLGLGLLSLSERGGAGGGTGSGAVLSLEAPIALSFARLRQFDRVVLLEMPGTPVAFPAADTAFLASARRRQEVAFVRYTSELLPGAPEVFAQFDLSDDVQAAAALKSAATVMLVVLFGLGAYLFSASSNKYCIQPIESIMKMMREFAKNPLARLGGGDDDDDDDDEADKRGAGDEAGGLKRSIGKIGDLLRIGFGDAGGRIIGTNLASRDGELNTRVPGTRIHAIFGFVVVFEFSLLTDCLKESIMLFVNHVAGVVHKTVHGHAGSCNKNIGDAWLVVWPLKSATDTGSVLPRGTAVQQITGGTGHTTADCALAAFALSPLLIKGNEAIAQLSQHMELQRASPGYEISMGYGLHSGWAIEGAIGSDLKIDASYLSPNVNLASRLEAASKQYRVPLLFSSDVFEILSPRRAALCRKVDVVTVKGSTAPMTLYTYDIALDAANVRAAAALTERWVDTQRHWKAGRADEADEHVHGGEAALTTKDRVDASVEAIFSLRRTGTPHFVEAHARALAAYLLGDWRGAARLFREALALKPGDGPSETLLAYMERRLLAPPVGWRGVRELTSK